MLRIASVPGGHVYVRHLSSPSGDDGVVRLPDPGGKPWPSAMLDPHWIEQHAGDFDVFHIHFGFDALGPADLAAVLDALRQQRKPLVYTVHDLRNPHQMDRTLHDEALDQLIPAAAELITLTPGAAAEILERWGRTAAVLPHPHVVDLETMQRPRPHRERPTVGVHLKSLRASIDPLPVLGVLLDAAPSRGIDLIIDVHTDVVTPGMYNHSSEVAAFLAGLAGTPGVRVHVHDYYTDDELWDYFFSLDLSVLPYRFGTHSGWLEASYDVGTRVLAPRLGYYHDQHDGLLGYRVDESGPRADDIVAALDALPTLVPWRADVAYRLAQREEIASAHTEIYRRALTGAQS